MSGIVFAKNSGLNNEVFGKSAEPIKAIIVQGVESWEEKSLIDKIFYMDTTENFAEKYHNMKLSRVNVIVLMKKPVPIPKNPRNTIITNPRKGPNPK